MQYKSARGFTGWGQLALLLAFLGAGFILAVIMQFAIASSLIGSNVPLAKMGDVMQAALFKPENAIYLQLSQVLGTFFMMFLPALLYMRICHGKNKLWLGFSNHINVWQIVLGFCLIFCANIVANPVADLSKAVIAHFPNLNHKAQSLEDLYSDTVEAISGLKTWGQFFLALVIMAFFPALFEEMLFRGALQNLFVHWWKKPVLAIIFTSVLFSIVHTSIYFFLSRAILGFALGWMYYRSKNLWVNIMAHFLNNALVVVQMFVMARSSAKPDLSKLDDRMPLLVELLAIAVFYALFVLFDKVSAKNKAKVEADEQKLWIASTPWYNLAGTQNEVQQ